MQPGNRQPSFVSDGQVFDAAGNICQFPHTLNLTPDPGLPMKTFLHIGCGHKHKDKTTRGFNTPGYALWALAVKQPMAEDELKTLAREHFPVK
jgi:hypothetical protein